MKRLSAILFSLLLVWTQAVLAAHPTADNGSRAACKCCDCGSKSCCAKPPAPESSPSPAAPIRATSQNELSPLALTFVAWTVPAIEPQISDPAVSFSRFVTGVPLFTRHCALLV